MLLGFVDPVLCFASLTSHAPVLFLPVAFLLVNRRAPPPISSASPPFLHCTAARPRTTAPHAVAHLRCASAAPLLHPRQAAALAPPLHPPRADHRSTLPGRSRLELEHHLPSTPTSAHHMFYLLPGRQFLRSCSDFFKICSGMVQSRVLLILGYWCTLSFTSFTHSICYTLRLTHTLHLLEHIFAVGMSSLPLISSHLCTCFDTRSSLTHTSL